MHTWINKYIYIYIHTHTHTYIQTCIYTVYSDLVADIDTDKDMYTHMHIYIYIYPDNGVDIDAGAQCDYVNIGIDKQMDRPIDSSIDR